MEPPRLSAAEEKVLAQTEFFVIFVKSGGRLLLFRSPLAPLVDLEECCVVEFSTNFIFSV